MGPTAIGKTELACEWLQHFPFEIISIDSAMIYRDMDIGSAKPNTALLAQAPHHLINILSPEESYSAAQCCTDVLRIGQEIESRGKIPLLVGGTMMYFRALQQGLSALPTSDPTIRATIVAEAEATTWATLHRQLSQIDPQAAQRIHPNDTQRITRALEIYRLTQQPLSAWLQATQHAIDRKFTNLILMPTERSWLHERIALRFKAMLAEGLIEEVRNLHNKYSLKATHPSMRCVGYRQVCDYLQDHQDRAALEEKGIAATRQLAKRQMTWLRHWPQAHIFSVHEHLNLREMIAFMQQITHN
jgi:tRNA dimethylallyltransferase